MLRPLKEAEWALLCETVLPSLALESLPLVPAVTSFVLTLEVAGCVMEATLPISMIRGVITVRGQRCVENTCFS
jgi:hypothetical protein